MRTPFKNHFWNQHTMVNSAFLKSLLKPMRTPTKSHVWHRMPPLPRVSFGTTTCATTCTTEAQHEYIYIYIYIYMYIYIYIIICIYFGVSFVWVMLVVSSSLSLLTFSCVPILKTQWLSSPRILVQHGESQLTLQWSKTAKWLRDCRSRWSW